MYDTCERQQANIRDPNPPGMNNPLRGPLSDRIDTGHRFRCLELAIGASAHTGEDPVKAAERFFVFVTNADGRNVRETVLDALNQAGVD